MDKLQQAFNEWVSEVLTEQPSDDIIAYNFNIYEEDEEYLVEIIGSNTFSEESDDWVADENEIWNSGPLMFIIPLDAFDGDWEDFHNLIAELIDRLLDTDLIAASYLQNSQAITVGFIDGDLEILWQNN